MLRSLSSSKSDICMQDDRNATPPPGTLAPKSTNSSPAARPDRSLSIRPKRRIPAPKPGPEPEPDAPGSCLFLTALPIELRNQIYLELMRPLGDAVHIFQRKGRFLSATCISDHSQDDRQERIENCIREDEKDSKYFYSPTWRSRLANPWSNHWMCEEETHGEISVIRRVQLARCIMPLLLTCKTT